MDRSVCRAVWLLAGISLGVSCSSEPQGAPPPNIVFIIIDTLRADMLSSYGHPADPSPALTRLASGGVQFDSVISQTSWTLPSIGSMLVSQYPRTLGLYHEGDQVLPVHFDTLAEILKDGGYATFGATANPNINSRVQFDQGFDTYVDSMVVFGRSRQDAEEGEIFFRDSKLHSAGGLLGQAYEFASEQLAADAPKPVYLQLNLMEVHEYARGNMVRPAYKDLFPGQENRAYLQMVRQVTDDIEVFVHKVRELPGWEDALFCITSDHGEGLSDHPGLPFSQGHGALLYPSMVHVPWLLFRSGWKPKESASGTLDGAAAPEAPWVPQVSSVKHDVRLLDVLPTLLDVAGLEVPEGIQGVSLKAILEGDEQAADELLPEFIVTETYFRQFRKISAFGKTWQYVDNRGSEQDLPPLEIQARSRTANGSRTNVASKHPELVKRMRRFVGMWEKRFAEAPALTAGEELSEETLRQLEAIGYTR